MIPSAAKEILKCIFPKDVYSHQSDEETKEKEPDDVVLILEYKFLLQINVFENKNVVK